MVKRSRKQKKMQWERHVSLYGVIAVSLLVALAIVAFVCPECRAVMGMVPIK